MPLATTVNSANSTTVSAVYVYDSVDKLEMHFRPSVRKNAAKRCARGRDVGGGLAAAQRHRGKKANHGRV